MSSIGFVILMRYTKSMYGELDMSAIQKFQSSDPARTASIINDAFQDGDASVLTPAAHEALYMFFLQAADNHILRLLCGAMLCEYDVCNKGTTALARPEQVLPDMLSVVFGFPEGVVIACRLWAQSVIDNIKVPKDANDPKKLTFFILFSCIIESFVFKASSDNLETCYTEEKSSVESWGEKNNVDFGNVKKLFILSDYLSDNYCDMWNKKIVMMEGNILQIKEKWLESKFRNENIA